MSSGVVLAFDTATAATVVGLSVDGNLVGQLADRPGSGERPNHAERLLSLCDHVLAEAGKRWEDVDRIGVGIGPGTFTGLRIGMATARGLQQGCRSALVAISTLEAISLPARAAYPELRVAAVADGRRSEAFVACWSPDGLLTLDAQAVGPQQLSAAIGADGDPAVAVGDGAILFRGSLEEASITVPDDDSPLHQIDAASLCHLASTGDPADSGILTPNYVRRADAEIALEKRARSGD